VTLLILCSNPFLVFTKYISISPLEVTM